MKKTFIIPTRETSVLPNNNLYCKVYKNGGVNSELVHKFGIKPGYLENCEWLIELSTEDINEYMLFYYRYIINQLDSPIKLEGNNHREVETALDTTILLMGIRFHLNYLDWNSIMSRCYDNILGKLQEYAIRTKDKSLLEKTLFRNQYIKYWYNFNN